LSGRVAYLERAAQGTAVVGLRIVGERDDESLPAKLRESQGSAGPDFQGIAAWMKDRLPKADGGGPTLDLLCLDTDGTLCTWLATPSADGPLVAALARQGGADGWGEEESRGSVLSTYAGMPQEAAVQPLALQTAPTASRTKFALRKAAPAAAPAPRQRMGVLAASDVAARLLLDALDSLGVRVTSVCSLWHAAAAAWDPTGLVYAKATGRKIAYTSAQHAEHVVAESSSIHATVLVDTSGRLHWSWADKGRLLAGGSIRLRTSSAQSQTADQPPRVALTKPDVSRLAAEWLAWSVQLGLAPARIACIVPEDLSAEPASLDAAQFGAALTAAWPGTSVDLAVVADPVGATLARLAAAATVAQDSGQTRATFTPADPRQSLVQLAHRPGISHFRLHLWAALAVCVLSAGLGAWAWQFQLASSAATAASRKASTQWRELFKQLNLPGPVLPGTELAALKTEIAKRERDNAPIKSDDPEMPILQELETLSLVLSSEDIDLIDLTLDSRGITRPRVVVLVPSLAVAEQLGAALKQIAGSNLVNWTTPDFINQADGKVRATYTASWSPQASSAQLALPPFKPGDNTPAAGGPS